jgi:hypothetical protein
MIGPWESFGREDFSIVHPPEISVDFDAVYTDGQVGTGVMETDSHPIKVIGEEVYLDGTLRWKFMQSESMHNTVPVTTGHSTYYAYTELYFDEATTMLVAIGTDDSGRVWINGKDVWRDYGTSWYNIDEHITPFQFRQGLAVNSHMQTSHPHIYAIGDITGFSMLAHTASREAEVAVNHLVGIEDGMNYNVVPAVVYTNPEVAGVGATEDALQAKGINYLVAKLPMTFSGRFVAENEGGNGLCKLIFNEEQQLLGAHIIGNPASELITTATLAMERGLTVDQFKKLIFPHPSVGEIFKETLFTL